jgi:hypothetical protein
MYALFMTRHPQMHQFFSNKSWKEAEPAMMQLPAETAIGPRMRFNNGSGGHFSNPDA